MLKKTNTYGYDTTWKDKLTSYNGETITYDAIGNPLKYRNEMTMQWKNGRQLSQVKTAKDTVTYKYNINGLRTRKDNSDYTNYYYYDENNNLIAMMQGGTVAYFYYDSNNSITAMSLNNTMYYYIKNLQGDVTKIVDEKGKVKVEYTYDAWGNILNETANVDQTYATVQDFNPFRYRGYVYDTDTGLYYLQSRYYDPKTGRFINADDTAYVDTNSGTPLSTNMFAYCENNIMNRSDFLGYSATTIGYFDGKYTIMTYLKHKNKKHYYNWICYNGIIKFDNSKNNIFWAILRRKTKDLAKEVYNSAKRCNHNYLTGRTVDGIYYELVLHYFAYKLGIKTSSSKIADMGSSRRGCIGYDSNAIYFETASIIIKISKIIRDFRNNPKISVLRKNNKFIKRYI